jgi:hypothetical protein
MRKTLFLLLLISLPCRAAAQRVVGRVVDATSGNAIAQAQVRLESASGDRLIAVSDSAGRFTIRVKGAGVYRISAAHLSYATSTATLDLAEQVQVEVLLRLAVAALELPALEVIARSRAPDAFLEQVGFYDRKGAGFGVFLDPDEIERRRPLHTTDLFQRMSGVRVIHSGGIRGNDIRITRAEDPNCPPRVYVDRVVVRRGVRMESTDPTLDMLVQPTQIHAIEVFRSPSEVPTEFGGSFSTCGVVVIWTKRGAAG